MSISEICAYIGICAGDGGNENFGYNRNNKHNYPPPFLGWHKVRSVVAGVDDRSQNACGTTDDSENYSRTHNITPFKVKFPCEEVKVSCTL